MPFDCAHRAAHGFAVCLTECPTHAEVGGFRFARVERDGDVPPADPRVVDVALLDMHHGWPNLGHEALTDVIQSAVCDLRAHLAHLGLSVRVISYDVRRGHALPEAPGDVTPSTSAPAVRAISIRAPTTAVKVRRASSRTRHGRGRCSRCSTRFVTTIARRCSPSAIPSA